MTMKANRRQTKGLKVKVRWTETEPTPAMERLLSLLLTPREDYERGSDGNGEKADERENKRPNY